MKLLKSINPVFPKPDYTVMVYCLLITCLFTACGSSDLIRGFRVGFSASKPAIQSLVPGTISQAKADVVIRDVDAGITAAERGEQCIKGITETGPQKRVGQARCYLALASDLRVILARHNIGGSPLLDQIASLVDAAIMAFEEFSRSVIPNSMAASLPSDDSGKAAEDLLKDRLRDIETQLKALKKMGHDDDSLSRDGRAIVKAINAMSANQGKWLGAIVEAIVNERATQAELDQFTAQLNTGTAEVQDAINKQTKGD